MLKPDQMVQTAPLIVVEGADGAGTTSVAAALVQRLVAAGRPVWATALPSTGPVGALLRQVLASGALPSWRTMAHLFLADIGLHVERVIRPLLAAGTVVVCDRYYPSTVVYQGLSDGGGWTRMVALAEEIYGGEAPWEAAPSWVVAPARTLWLDAAPEVLWARVVGRGQPLEGYEAEAFHRQVVQGYRVFAHEIAPRMALTRLDAAQPLEDVVAAAWAEVQAALAEGTRGAQVA